MLPYQQESLLGAMALSKGKYQEAIIHLENAIRLAKSNGINSSDESFEVDYFNLAQSKKAMQRYAEAITDFQKVLTINPKNESAYIHLTKCCFEVDTQQTIEIAINELNNCTGYFPKNISAFMNKGIAYLKLGENIKAKSAFQSAKSLGNKDADNFISGLLPINKSDNSFLFISINLVLITNSLIQTLQASFTFKIKIIRFYQLIK